MKKRFITSLWGGLLLIVICTWPVSVVPLWIITGFNLFTHLFEHIDTLLEEEPERLKTQI